MTIINTHPPVTGGIHGEVRDSGDHSLYVSPQNRLVVSPLTEGPASFTTGSSGQSPAGLPWGACVG
jgi:hypothetical protein